MKKPFLYFILILSSVACEEEIVCPEGEDKLPGVYVDDTHKLATTVLYVDQNEYTI